MLRRSKVAFRHRSVPIGQQGFTLLELLVVLGILALIAALAGPQVIRYLGSARSTTAKTQVNELQVAVELFYVDNNRYPTAEEGVQALITRPPTAEKWAGPYLQKASGLTDPWGRAYLYKFPGEHGRFDIFSLGADGQQGGEGEDQDVTSW